MVLIAGTLNCIWGIAAIAGSSFFVEDQRFIIEDLNTLGWIVLGIGVIQLLAAFSIWAGAQFGRWVGIVGASIGALGALLSIPGFPLWSVCVFFINILIVYGLATYGGRGAQTT